MLWTYSAYRCDSGVPIPYYTPELAPCVLEFKSAWTGRLGQRAYRGPDFVRLHRAPRKLPH
jgi:hypothetical protein